MLHPGNLRTALYNMLLARHRGGSFLLRIEDTDAAREAQLSVEGLCADLRWCGIDWDEGFGRGGGHGPYRQSERRGIYDELLARLESTGHAYECWLSEAELKAHRDAAVRAGRAPRHRRADSALDPADKAARRAAGARPVLRFEMTATGVDRFQDIVHGEQRFPAADMGDFVIRRADGTAAFLFANAVDDALMDITDVLRGEDHLSNTPRQIAVLVALGLPVPRYGHLPLVVDTQGKPLSKRQASYGIAALREAGFLPEAVVNHVARLGHPFAGDSLLDLESLAQHFDTDALGRAPARFDAGQLRHHWQPLAVRHVDRERLWQWLDEATKELVPPPCREPFLELVRPNVMFPADAAAWAGILFGPVPLSSLEPDARREIEAAGAELLGRAASTVEHKGAALAGLVEDLAQMVGGRRGRVLKPVRAAVTGRLAGPDLQAMLSLMETGRVRARLEAAAEMAGDRSR
jgi:glutamyl-tRNA synthetase